LTLRFIQNVRTSVGIVRTELQFVMLGSAVGIGFAMLTTVILPVVTHNTIWVRFAPSGRGRPGRHHRLRHRHPPHPRSGGRGPARHRLRPAVRLPHC
jgi:hypothetical protein